MTAAESTQSALDARPVPATAQTDLPPERSESSELPQRHALIAEAAFFIAQERGFAPGHELDDWLAAEREVDQRLSAIQHRACRSDAGRSSAVGEGRG
jgi:hypothetical protein